MKNIRIIDQVLSLKSNCLKKEDNIRGEFGLLPAEYKGIHTIGLNEILKCSDFSRKMELSDSRGSRVIDKLVKNGYLKYEFSDYDKRVVFIKLTARGKIVKSKIEKMLEECDNIIQHKLSKSEINNFSNSINKISKILNK